MKKIITFIILLSIGFFTYGCQEKPIEYDYGDEEMIARIWDDAIIYNETVVLVDDGQTISGQLLFVPQDIISVRDYTLQKEYDKNEYTIEGNTIFRTEGSTMPYLTSEQLMGENLPEDYQLSTYQAKEQGKNIVFTEGIGLVMHQIAITYVRSSSWEGHVPTSQTEYLNNFLNKVNRNEDVKVLFYGDSIFTGANASSYLGIAPFSDSFPNLVKSNIEKTFDVNVELINTSFGGALSQWGKDNVVSNVINYEPDLVVIGFGMNDGSLNVTPTQYIENIEFMVRSIQANLPNTDIIIVSTILPNPISIQNLRQPEYLIHLEELRSNFDVALVDMTSITQELYKYKKGVDVLANNINHPSDFLVRIYAAAILEALNI